MWNSIIANINLIKLNIVELKKFIKIKIKKPHLLPIRRTVSQVSDVFSVNHWNKWVSTIFIRINKMKFLK